MATTYGTSTALTITAGSLPSNAARSSAAVTSDTAVNLEGYEVTVNVLTTTSAPSGNKQVAVYFYRSEDGSNYQGNSGTTDNVDGTDKALTALGSPSALTLAGALPLNQGAVAVTARGVFDLPWDSIPPKWGIVLHNDAGVTLGATVTATYRSVYKT